MPSGIARPIKPVLYIEGKRMDNAFIRATCNGEVGKPATAVISLVPTETIRHILPRTYVHLFCNDPWDANDSEPKLLFEGEVLGMGFIKNDDGRAFVIHCADVSNYWHHVRQYWFNITQSGGNFLDNFIRMTVGGEARIATVAPFGVKGYILNRLNLISGEENLFLDSMIGLLDDIGNISSFYQNARRRLRITDRILRRNAGNVQNLLQLSFFTDWLQQLISARSGETNLLSIISLLLNIIYHEYVSVLAPPYVTSTIIKRDKSGNPIRKDEDGKRNNKTLETEEKKVVANFIFKPHIYTLPPPSCNVLFPNMYDGIEYNRDFTKETTRMTLTPQVMEKKSPLNFLKLKVFMRPIELDTFFQLVTSGSGTNSKIEKRPSTAQYGDGQGQSATVKDWEFMTNEERFKGINPKFQKLAPAPAILSLQNQGSKDITGKRTGGVPKYVHNVASYEYFMNKFVTRSLRISGLFNTRPVPGYPLLALDDSNAKMHMVGYLHGITHVLNASSGVSTSYNLVLPREVDEIDLNRPILDKDTGAFEFKIVNGERVFDFDKMFSSKHRPPIPEWFDDDFKTIGKLTELYQSFFGDSVVSSEDVRGSALAIAEAIQREKAERTKGDPKSKGFTESVADKETNSIFSAATKQLINDYALAQQAGVEFDFVSAYTERAMATSLQAFAFMGALPKNFKSGTPVPILDEEYVGHTVLRAFTEEEAGVSTSTTDSTFPIYDGKPIPHPFELELYTRSLAPAKAAGEPLHAADKYVRSMTMPENGPTGPDAENATAKPLGYPLSEQQIIKARRSIINMYRQEMLGKRGFRG